MSASPARKAALDAITEVRTRSAYAHEVVPTVLARRTLSDRDAALATRIAYGTIASVGTLDEVLVRVSDRPLDLEPRVRDALRLATWELIFGEAEPYVAVSEGVALVRSVRPQAAGLANALLRKVADAREAFPWGDPASSIEALARATAHPLWIAELLADEYGHQTALAVLRANNTPAPLFLAHNPFAGPYERLLSELSDGGVDCVPCEPPGCLIASEPSAAVRSSALSHGLAIVADAAAQLVASLLDTRPGDRVLEIGAGRGTKTLLIQATAAGRGGVAEVTAVDIHGYRSSLLARRMSDLGVPGVRAVTADATDPDALSQAVGDGYDRVLIDAPCSGLGTLRRHPEARWRLSPHDISDLASLGSALLAATAPLVKPGGFMVYSTCTVVRPENGSVVHAFLSARHGRGFTVDALGPGLSQTWRRWVTGEGFFQSLPETGGPDGHFAARLVRASGSDASP